MTIGVGGSSFDAELAKLKPDMGGVEPITVAEYRERIAQAQKYMRENGYVALYIDATSNLTYFSGIQLNPSERLHGMVIPVDGDVAFICPAFEEPKTRELMLFGHDVRCWEEHENPAALVVETIRSLGSQQGVVALDPHTPFFTVDELRKAGGGFSFANGGGLTSLCREIKSAHELALMQKAMDITMAVHRAAARGLRAGVTTTETVDFLDRAHRRLGVNWTSCSAQFGEATAYPHGVKHPQVLRDGDMVLIDMSTKVNGYRSDITRSFVFGEPSERQAQIWNLEKKAQMAAFDAAVLGAPCEAVDRAARRVIEEAGFGPDYKVPGLPHRTGHGLGIDVHETPYMVRGNQTLLRPGMCFSNEPMICIYGEFGVRLEDIIYMTEAGARWFTEPAASLHDPFGYEAR
ncbi:M24 family metallopeptidase [Bosea sp. NPDC055332]